jgi:hypothetical protein
LDFLPKSINLKLNLYRASGFLPLSPRKLSSMLINFKYSGGYANLQLNYWANTDNLPKEIREELLALIEKSQALKLQPQQGEAYPDALTYELELSTENHHQLLAFDDRTVPSQLRPLLTRLQELAISSR